MSFAFSNLRSSLLLPAAVISAVGLSSYLLLNRPPSVLPSYISSPRTKLSSLTEAELAKLPYPPTFYPGGRWVKTPHGTIRVYEFGPEDGRKVLFVHGISTPCCVYRDVAWRLVEEGGCRVMLFGMGQTSHYLPTIAMHLKLISSQTSTAVAGVTPQSTDPMTAIFTIPSFTMPFSPPLSLGSPLTSLSP